MAERKKILSAIIYLVWKRGFCSH